MKPKLINSGWRVINVKRIVFIFLFFVFFFVGSNVTIDADFECKSRTRRSIRVGLLNEWQGLGNLQTDRGDTLID